MISSTLASTPVSIELQEIWRSFPKNEPITQPNTIYIKKMVKLFVDKVAYFNSNDISYLTELRSQIKKRIGDASIAGSRKTKLRKTNFQEVIDKINDIISVTTPKPGQASLEDLPLDLKRLMFDANLHLRLVNRRWNQLAKHPDMLLYLIENLCIKVRSLDHLMQKLKREGIGSRLKKLNLKSLLSEGEQGKINKATLTKLIKICPMLIFLSLSSCKINNLTPLTNCTTLMKLDLHCGFIATDLKPLSNCTTLTKLSLNYSSKLSDPSNSDNVDDLTTLSNLETLSNYKILKKLYISFSRVSNFAHLTNCTSLKLLNLAGSRIRDLTPLANCTALQQLNLAGCYPIDNLGALAKCTVLQQLNLSNCEKVSDLTPLANCTALQQLNLYNCFNVRNINPLANCTALQQLNLPLRIRDIIPLKNCTALQRLRCRSVSDLTTLANCTGLKQLFLPQSYVRDLEPLRNCTVLQILDLSDNNYPLDVAPLAKCINLQELEIDMVCGQSMEILKESIPNIRDVGIYSDCSFPTAKFPFKPYLHLQRL